MKLRYLIAIALIFPFLNTNAQEFLGVHQSNYAGVTALDLQPAELIDSRYRVDVNLGGLYFGAYNSYLSFDGSALKGFLFDINDTTSAMHTDPDWFRNNITEHPNAGPHSVYVGTRIAGPSFMVTLDNKHAFGLGMSVRNFVNVDGLNTPIAKLMLEELDESTLWNTQFSNESFSFQTVTWAEYWAAYGGVLYDDGEHFVKVGGRLKLLQGLQAAYMFIENLNYSVSNTDTISLFTSDVQYGHSNNWELEDNAIQYKLISKLGLGLDLGVVYEWRRDGADFKYDMDGQEGLWMDDRNKYKLKVGLSVTDIGRLKFDKGQYSGDFTADVSLWDINDLDGITSVQDFDDTLRNRFTELSSDERDFNMTMPTVISLQTDYHFVKDFYGNFNAYVAFQFKKNSNKAHYFSNYSISPRYDHKWGGVSVPLSYSRVAGFRVGMGWRLGPLFFGTGDIRGILKKGQLKGGDIYAAVKVPILIKGPKDRDKDKVSDKLDECIETPGVWEFKGCPDTDGDHIPDTEDDCPLVAGPKEFKGCPDTDKDGIIDKLDSCRTVPGIPEFSGCPDTDKDGIKDSNDDCPEVPGIKEFNGCPDRDSDGTKDSDDLCPDDPGPKENNGCPDKDNDGLFDYIDECPDVPGPKENNGCPWPDTDEDGILDKDDKCPNNPGPKENEGCPYADTDKDGTLDKDDECVNTPGPKENKGCPIIKEEEQEILNTAFENLEFESGKAIIANSSYTSLVELANLLKKKPEWKLVIAGHTDNVGNDRNNLILSKKRAEAVKTFLSENGVEIERLTAEYYGETKPIESNDTKEGRQKNRRVEMTIEFE
jgi:outer membrane protein OmpA-like peptidoglycan-associated protein